MCPGISVEVHRCMLHCSLFTFSGETIIPNIRTFARSFLFDRVLKKSLNTHAHSWYTIRTGQARFKCESDGYAHPPWLLVACHELLIDVHDCTLLWLQKLRLQQHTILHIVLLHTYIPYHTF